MKVMGVINCFEIELESCFRGGSFIFGVVIYDLGGYSFWDRF